MTTFLIFIAGVALGFEVGRRVGRANPPPRLAADGSALPLGKGGEAVHKTETLIERQAREKEEDKQRIFGLLETNTLLSVGDIKMMLDIPESSATRYFDELEKEGKVRQVGARGRYVSYERA